MQVSHMEAVNPEESVQRRVLIVDDNPELRGLLADCLETAGYLPIQAQNGLAGWLAFREQSPHLAVVDLSMPVMSGFRLLWLLRAAKPAQAPHIPVVVISGHDPQEASEVIAATRPEAYLLKPFGPERFLSTVRALLGSGPEGSAG